LLCQLLQEKQVSVYRAIIRLKVAWLNSLACAGGAACRPTVECYRRWQTTMTDSRERNNTGPPRLCRWASDSLQHLYTYSVCRWWLFSYAVCAFIQLTAVFSEIHAGVVKVPGLERVCLVIVNAVLRWPRCVCVGHAC